mgnify:CR=1 FL=1
MHRETCTVLMGCSKGSAVRLAPSSLLCAQTGRAWAGLCAWALLLVVVTPSRAAGPFWWQCGRPAWATTCGVNLRSEGAQASTCPVDPAIPVANAAAPAAIAFASRRG